MKKGTKIWICVIILITLSFGIYQYFDYIPEDTPSTKIIDKEYNPIESLQSDTVSFNPKHIEGMQSITDTNGKTSYFLYYTDEDCNMFSLEVEMTESLYNTVLDMWELSIQSQCKTYKQQYYIDALNDMLHKHQFIIINNKPRLEYENL